MSATSSPFPVPSGLYPPFAVVTATDHTAWIIITTAIGLSLILQFGIIKITIRWSINPGLDEAVLGVSTVRLQILHSVCVTYTTATNSTTDPRGYPVSNIASCVLCWPWEINRTRGARES